MGRIFYLMGKSASGKDSMYNLLVNDTDLKLKTITLYTTRPVRANELNGREYYFCDNDFFLKMKAENKIIESRTYDTMHGPWTYFTLDDGQINIKENNYLIIGTLESYEKTREYFGAEVLVPIYITVETGERLTRALNREKMQAEPKYAEMCRRFLADEEDFSEKNLDRCEIKTAYENTDLNLCFMKIKQMIMDYKM